MEVNGGASSSDANRVSRIPVSRKRSSSLNRGGNAQFPPKQFSLARSYSALSLGVGALTPRRPSNRGSKSHQLMTPMTDSKRSAHTLMPSQDKHSLLEQRKRIEEYIAANFNHTESLKNLTITIFIDYMRLLLQQFFPRIQLNKLNYMEEIPRHLTQLEYPFLITKSFLRSVNIASNWPTVLLMLGWLVAISDSAPVDELQLDEDDDDDDDDFLGASSRKIKEIVRNSFVVWARSSGDEVGDFFETFAEWDKLKKEYIETYQQRMEQLDKETKRVKKALTEAQCEMDAVETRMHELISEKQVKALEEELQLLIETHRKKMTIVDERRLDLKMKEEQLVACLEQIQLLQERSKHDADNKSELIDLRYTQQRLVNEIKCIKLEDKKVHDQQETQSLRLSQLEAQLSERYNENYALVLSILKSHSSFIKYSHDQMVKWNDPNAVQMETERLSRLEEEIANTEKLCESSKKAYDELFAKTTKLATLIEKTQEELRVKAEEKALLIKENRRQLDLLEEECQDLHNSIDALHARRSSKNRESLDDLKRKKAMIDEEAKEIKQKIVQMTNEAETRIAQTKSNLETIRKHLNQTVSNRDSSIRTILNELISRLKTRALESDK